MSTTATAPSSSSQPASSFALFGMVRARVDPLQARAARFVMGWAMVAAVVMAAYGGATGLADQLGLTPEEQAVRGPVGLVGFALAAVVYALARAGHVHIAARAAVVFCLGWVVVSGSIFYTVNPQSRYVALWVVALAVPVLTAALLVSWKGTAVVGSVAVAVAVGVYGLAPDDARALWGATEVLFALSGCAMVLALRRDRDLASLRAAEAEREAFHARLVLTDRLASLGMVAAGVVHEVNNPLTTLRMLSAELERAPEMKGSRLWRERLCDLQEAVEHIGAISSDLGGLSRMHDSAAEDPGATGEVDPAEPLATAIRMVRPRVERRAHLRVEVGDLPRVTTQPSKLAQVFINLLLNAAQATERGRKDRTITVRGRRDGDRVVFEVEDEGEGLDPAQAEHLFAPFVTTKSEEEGTGLGLYIARKIVREAGGDITVSGAPGRGACFRVVLPVARG